MCRAAITLFEHEKNIDRESLLFYIHKFPWRTATANIRLNPAISRAITLANVEYFISTN